MKGNLGFRVIFSVIFLAVFGVYSMKHFSSGWFSEDVASWGPAGGLKPEEAAELVSKCAADNGFTLDTVTIKSIKAC